MTETCAWCGAPAITTIELEPVRMGCITSPTTGEKVKRPVERAKTAAVCAEHASVRDRRGGGLDA